MTLKEFSKKYIGEKVDYDGKYGCQCVDLFRQYCKDVWNIPHTGGVNGAEELYTKYEKLPLEEKYLIRIPYKFGNLPEEGDAVIFTPSKTNKYGHVAIVIRASPQTITVIEQDGLKQDGVHINTWDYKRVLGYLRKRSGK